MELMLFTCARSIHINTDRKELKQVLHFRFSFEPRFSGVDKSLFLAPPLRTTSCNVHYSGPVLYDNEKERLGASLVQFGKKHGRVSFSKTIKWHESERRVQFEVFEKHTSACFFSKLHEKPYYYLLIIYMAKIMQSPLNVCFFVLFLLEIAVSYWLSSYFKPIRKPL